MLYENPLYQIGVRISPSSTASSSGSVPSVSPWPGRLVGEGGGGSSGGDGGGGRSGSRSRGRPRRRPGFVLWERGCHVRLPLFLSLSHRKTGNSAPEVCSQVSLIPLDQGRPFLSVCMHVCSPFSSLLHEGGEQCQTRVVQGMTVCTFVQLGISLSSYIFDSGLSRIPTTGARPLLSRKRRAASASPLACQGCSIYRWNKKNQADAAARTDGRPRGRNK